MGPQFWATFALYLRSVYWPISVFNGLRCHSLTCMLLKVRLNVDSIPSALTRPSIPAVPDAASTSFHGQLRHSQVTEGRSMAGTDNDFPRFPLHLILK